jgi:MoaA/NifB/PqqE/SkfB family radical SAM enzyme
MLPDTEELRIETSTLCTYGCVFCPRDSFRRRKMAMECSLFEKILMKAKEQLPGIKYLSITGYGEIFADITWKEKIKTASSLFNRIHIITNLSLLETGDLDFLLTHVTDIRISAYAMQDSVYQRVHNPPPGTRLESIKEKIIYLIENRDREQKIILNYIETGLNEEETEKWIGFWREKADLLEVWRPHNWIDGREYRNKCAHREPGCYRPFSGPIQVLADGRVNLCCFDYNGELIIGDLNKQDFHEIYEGRELRGIRELHKNGYADSIPQCEKCDQRNCVQCRSRELIYNSHFTGRERVTARSGDFEQRLK